MADIFKIFSHNMLICYGLVLYRSLNGAAVLSVRKLNRTVAEIDGWFTCK